jgi:hypothetical protein
MAIISNGTTIASGGSLSVSANPPSSAGAVGTYALCRMESWSAESFGNTEAGSNLSPVSCAFGNGNSSGSTQSGTWRCMGSTVGNSGAEYNTTVWIRIS